MKRAKNSSIAARGPAPNASAPHVSLRTIYADAMREVMADPRKAVAEYDPWLAALLVPGATPVPIKD